jgi:hypothetical protein
MLSRPTLASWLREQTWFARPVDPDVEILGGAAKESGVRLDRGWARKPVIYRPLARGIAHAVIINDGRIGVAGMTRP